MDKDTQEKRRQIELEVKENKGKVMNRLLEMVYDIKPELHQNIRLD